MHCEVETCDPLDESRMPTTARPALLPLLALLIGCAPVQARRDRAVTAGLISTPSHTVRLTFAGNAMEIVGLRRWTPEMIQDSLNRYSLGDSLHSDGCAAVLRYRLHFADAAVVRFGNQLSVSVREPQDSVLVQYRRLALDTSKGRPEWRSITSLMTTPLAIYAGTDAVLSRGAAEGTEFADDSTLSRLFRQLDALNNPESYELARRTLNESPMVFDRLAAVWILARHPEQDDAWYELLDVVRESDGIVKSQASTVLAAWASKSPRAVNLMPAAAGIHAMLNGTSLFEHMALMQDLIAMKVGPHYAKAFLAGGGDMLLADLGSRIYGFQSHTLLTLLRGADLGQDAAAWRAWIATL